jgi:hypothetical protein
MLCYCMALMSLFACADGSMTMVVFLSTASLDAAPLCPDGECYFRPSSVKGVAVYRHRTVANQFDNTG